MRSISLVAAVLLLLAGPARMVGAQGTSDASLATSTTSLQDVRGVYLTVDAVDAALESDGLYRTAITATAERTLEAAGIPVLSREAVMQDPRRPHLTITVHSRLTGTGLHAYHLTMTFRQTVGLLHDPDVHLPAVTWTATPRTGAVARDQVEWLNDDLQTMLDAFVAAYQAANTD